MKLDNKFIGIPFVSGGRDFTGADCWGVAVLYYKEYKQIELPRFDGYYDSADNRALLKELIRVNKEGWERISKPDIGDIILFRVLGTETHVGVYIGDNKFLHAMEGVGSGVQDLDSLEWARRKVAFYRYSEKSKEQLPATLEKKLFLGELPADSSLWDILPETASILQIPLDTLTESIQIYVNDTPVHKSLWQEYKVKPLDKVEYRVAPRKDVLRIALVVVLSYYGGQFLAGTLGGSAAAGGGIAGAAVGAAGPAGIGLGLSTLGVAVGQVAIGMAAALLVNKIFPIRPPGQAADPGQAEKQLLITGSQNPATPYSSIPVILGRVRITPPLAAITYTETDTDLAFLKMLVCWGYGPLRIEDIKVGSTALNQFTGVVEKHQYGTSTDLTSVFANYGNSDVEQKYFGLKLVSDGTASTTGSPWSEYTFGQNITKIKVSIHFPQGLRRIQTKGEGAGSVSGAPFRAQIEYAPVGSEIWVDPKLVRQVTAGSNFNLTTEVQLTRSYNGQRAEPQWDTAILYKTYTWHVFGVDSAGNVVMLKGDPSLSPTTASNPPSVVQSSFYSTITIPRPANPVLKPVLPVDVAPLFNVCVTADYADPYTVSDGDGYTTVPGGAYYSIYASENTRNLSNYSYTGLLATPGVTPALILPSSPQFSIGTGSISLIGAPSGIRTIELGNSNEEFYLRKDAFSYTVQFAVPAGQLYKIRVRRTNSDELNPGGDDTYQNFHDAYLNTITGFYEGQAPVVVPRNCKLAVSSFTVQATDQLNASVEGVNGLVTTICKDYDQATDTWIDRPTNNPASLFRYILEHPANAQKIPTASLSDRVNIAELQDWHVFCTERNFAFNAVVAQQRSILEILRDIAAAGRASPMLKDGKWTVVIDRPRTTCVQYFTPHNSWNFEGAKALPKMPDAFRVVYNDETNEYQENEVIVYNTGKTAQNSDVYEEIRLPGITERNLAYAHGFWHLAQLKLRPEVYSLETDMEYLVCTRGDLVRVTHDVPMWGNSTGRIEARVSATIIRLSEDVLLEVGKSYTIRIRTSSGASVTRTLAAVQQSNYYRQITLQQSVTAQEAESGSLFMLGELENESQELIVLSIEPQANYTAKLTLVDYSPELFSAALIGPDDIPTFNPNITVRPTSSINQIFKTPEVQQVVSDESVLDVLSPGNFVINLAVTFAKDNTLPDQVDTVELQAKPANSGDDSYDYTWGLSTKISLSDSVAKISDVAEGQAYKIRARYLSSTSGRSGPWSEILTHTVVGKTNPPAQVAGLTGTLLSADALLQLTWTANSEPDLQYYEVRLDNTNWGQGGYVWRGFASQVDLPVLAPGTAVTYYVRARDYSGNYSETSSSFTLTVAAPLPATNLQYRYSTNASGVQTSNTNSTVTINWQAAQKTTNGLDVKDYSITIIRPGIPVVENVFISGTTYTTRADWLGDAEVRIATRDVRDNLSTQAVLIVTKQAPAAVVNAQAEVVDNNVFLRWTLPETTSLPISHVLIKRGPTWQTPDVIIGEKDGTFTSVIELIGGTYTYWIAAVDTDSRESVPVAVPAVVNQPPDFVFNAEFTGNFTGAQTTLVNSTIETNTGNLLMLVDTAETWQSHFTTRSWATIDSQIAAGFPIYAQPGVSTASYREVFDYTQTLSSSSITVAFTGQTVSGTVTTSVEIETSLNGTTWSSPVVGSSIFATNFRYVRVTLRASGVNNTALYLLTGIRVRLDSKQKSDSGNGTANSADTLGTIVNFTTGKEFVDVTSITVTPAGTQPRIAVYDFLDQVIAGTYTVTSNVATITAANHGLETGQTVRLSFSTGTAPSGVYSVTKVNANSYTVNITTGNTSGSVTTYPQSMRVYLFDNSGTRQSGQFGWSIRGY